MVKKWSLNAGHLTFEILVNAGDRMSRFGCTYLNSWSDNVFSLSADVAAGNFPLTGEGRLQHLFTHYKVTTGTTPRIYVTAQGKYLRAAIFNLVGVQHV